MKTQERAERTNYEDNTWDFDSYEITGFGADRKKQADKIIKWKSTYGWYVHESKLDSILSSSLVFRRKKDYQGPREWTFNKWWGIGLFIIPQVLIFFTASKKFSPKVRSISLVWLVIHSFFLYANQAANEHDKARKADYESMVSNGASFETVKTEEVLAGPHKGKKVIFVSTPATDKTKITRIINHLKAFYYKHDEIFAISIYDDWIKTNTELKLYPKSDFKKSAGENKKHLLAECSYISKDNQPCSIYLKK